MLTTIPRTGFIARLAIPVLKERDVMSRIAVPVVSDPVPAVVGTNLSRLILLIALSSGHRRTSNHFLQCLLNGQSFADWKVHKV